MFNPRVRSWMGLLGIFGFAGILGFILEQPSFLIFFVFFGFFGFYFEGKLNREKVDERLKENFQRAQRVTFRFVMTMTFIILLGATIRPEGNYQARFMLLTAAVAIMIGLAFLMVPALTIYYDRGYLDDPK